MAQKPEVAEDFIKRGYKVKPVLERCGLASSTWYYRKVDEDKRQYNKGRPCPGYTINPDGSKVNDNQIVTVLKEYRRLPEFANAGGYEKFRHHIFRDYGWAINHKKLYRLCRENKLLLPKVKKRKRRKSPICINRVITAPHQLWEVDLKYGYVHGENRFFFILVILDVFIRLVVNYYIGLRCQGRDLVFTLRQALIRHPEADEGLVIRSDNGSQMTSNVFMDYIETFDEASLAHELIPPATPNKNAHVEAFNSILEIEFLQTRYFMNYAQSYRDTVWFMDIYNNKRIHGSLNYRTPREVHELYLKGAELDIKPVRL